MNECGSESGMACQLRRGETSEKEEKYIQRDIQHFLSIVYTFAIVVLYRKKDLGYFLFLASSISSNIYKGN
jgi:hypothetical protein